MANRGRHKKEKLKHSTWLVNVIGKDVLNKMLEYQVNQRNRPDYKVFEQNPSASKYEGGFTWDYTIEGWSYWNNISEKIKNSSYYNK